MKRLVFVLAVALILMLMPFGTAYAWRGPVLEEPPTDSHPWGGEEYQDGNSEPMPTSVTGVPTLERADFIGIGAWFYQYAYRNWGWFRFGGDSRTVTTQLLIGGTNQPDSVIGKDNQ